MNVILRFATVLCILPSLSSAEPVVAATGPENARYAHCRNDKLDLVADLSYSDLKKGDLAFVELSLELLARTRNYSPVVEKISVNGPEYPARVELWLANGETSLILETRDFISGKGRFERDTALECTFAQSGYESRFNQRDALVLAACSGHRRTFDVMVNRPAVDINLRFARDLSEGEKSWSGTDTPLPLGDTALSCALRRGDQAMWTRLLSDPRIDPNALGAGGLPPLFFSVRQDDSASVAAMLKHSKIDLNAQSPDGRNVLFEVKTLDMFRTLLTEQGLNVNAPDREGVSFLHELASRPNSYDWLETILDARLELAVNLRNKRGENALAVAHARQPQYRMLLLRKRPDIDFSVLAPSKGALAFWAAKEGSILELADGVLKGVDLNITDDLGNTPVMTAAFKRNLGSKFENELIGLLTKWPDIDLTKRNREGETIFSTAPYTSSELYPVLEQRAFASAQHTVLKSVGYGTAIWSVSPSYLVLGTYQKATGKLEVRGFRKENHWQEESVATLSPPEGWNWAESYHLKSAFWREGEELILTSMIQNQKDPKKYGTRVVGVQVTTGRSREIYADGTSHCDTTLVDKDGNWVCELYERSRFLEGVRPHRANPRVLGINLKTSQRRVEPAHWAIENGNTVTELRGIASSDTRGFLFARMAIVTETEHRTAFFCEYFGYDYTTGLHELARKPASYHRDCLGDVATVSEGWLTYITGDGDRGYQIHSVDREGRQRPPLDARYYYPWHSPGAAFVFARPGSTQLFELTIATGEVVEIGTPAERLELVKLVPCETGNRILVNVGEQYTGFSRPTFWVTYDKDLNGVWKRTEPNLLKTVPSCPRDGSRYTVSLSDDGFFVTDAVSGYSRTLKRTYSPVPGTVKQLAPDRYLLRDNTYGPITYSIYDTANTK